MERPSPNGISATDPHTRIAVVILNWNTRERTLACVRGLLDSQPAHTQIILVDNNSGDGSAQAFCAAFPALTVLTLDQNYGFSRGVNHGIRYTLAHAAPDYVLLLNNDTTVTGSLLDQLAERMDRDPHIGIATPRIVYADTPDQLWGIGGTIYPHWLTVTGMNVRDQHQYDTFQPDFVFGCAMMIRRAVLEKVDLLDERFFFSYEDIEFCLRARQAGFGIAYFPEITLLHDGGNSTHGRGYLREYYMARSRLQFFRHWSHGLNFVKFLLRESLYVGGTVARCLLGGDFKTMGWYLKGWLEGFFLK